MEFGNSTNNILAPYYEKTSHSADNMDPCALHADICGMEAGCLNNLDGTFQCICHDLKPAGPNNSCDRTRAPLQSSSTDSSVTDFPHDIRPTGGKFDANELLKMLSPITFPTNLTDGVRYYPNENNFTQSNSTSEVVGPVPLGDGGPPVALIVCLLAMGLVTLYIGLLCFFLPGGRRCSWSGRSRNAAVRSLSKCMQQYVANPNYSSSAPDAPLVRGLQLQEEVGEDCFGRVHNDLASVSGCENCYPDSPMAEFEREEEIAASFRHPAILGVLRGAESGNME